MTTYKIIRWLDSNTAEVEEAPPAPIKEEAKPKEKPDIDKENDTGRKPPKEGICKRCGQNRPINRLMLCYRCWVIVVLEDNAKARGEVWTEGMPHPASCDCVGLGEHKSGDGTARGFN